MNGLGRVQVSSDLFSFGVLAWEVLTQHRPWPGPPLFIVMAGQPLDPPAQPLPLGEPATALVRSAVSADPGRRPNAKELALALRQAAESSS